MTYQQQKNNDNCQNSANWRRTEQKWQKTWDKLANNKVNGKENSQLGDKEYILVEFPYPSGSGLHIGHGFSFTGADVYARFRRMNGKNVLFPIGWDAFGLPTENYAIKEKKNPQKITKENTTYFKKQMRTLALSFDWEREVNTTDPDYYKWTQWIFLKLFEKGLVYKREMPINWCPNCKIGLANEEVIDAHCERCGAETERRNISQWIVKITDYADRLIQGLDKTDFIEKVKAAQINWIGKSEGASVIFKIVDNRGKLEIFTTRPDTLWGATFMVVAPEHQLVQEILDNSVVSNKKKQEIKNYLNQTKKKSDLERTELNKEKTGVFTGFYAINPVNDKKIQIWISDFVLSNYGAGAIMAVPAHDERDWAFAKKFGLEIIPVIKPKQDWDFNQGAYTNVDEGEIINSDPINGLVPSQAFKKMIEWLKGKNLGQKTSQYHLRDWIFSRQHYWGEPIPLVFCENCAKKQKNEGFSKGEILNPGWIPVLEKDLPIVLPEVENYQPTQTGKSPLSDIKEWTDVKCPRCGYPAKRETDTMPNWAGSDWYYLAYCFADRLKNSKSQIPNFKQYQNINIQNPKNFGNHEIETKKPQNIFSESKDILHYWLPVDIYIGGDEHNTLHLLYSRFIYQFLWDIGVVPKEFPEPYQKRISHGVILGPDGQRMSKSRGNVILPEEVIGRFSKYGPDILRIYLMFLGPFDSTMIWNDDALMGVKKFLDRVENYIDIWLNALTENKNNKQAKVFLHQTIKKVTADLESMKFNTAVASLMEFLNKIKQLAENIIGDNGKNFLEKGDLEKFIILLSPFAPYFCEEQWQKIKFFERGFWSKLFNRTRPKNKSIFQQSWPKCDESLIQGKYIELVIQINGKLRDRVSVPTDITEGEAKKIALERQKIKEILFGKKIKKTIFVPKKLINIVAD